MTRRFALCSGYLLFAIAATTGAQADELPLRKAGLWEMKVVDTGGSSMPKVTMQHCTDETVDKEMNNNTSPVLKQICSKQDLRKTATGFVSDSVCEVGGMTMTSHAEMTGDFNSAYTMKSTSHVQGEAAGAAGREITATIEAKWLGACKADQKPGDIVMPGGLKMNVKDMAKLRDLLPKK